MFHARALILCLLAPLLLAPARAGAPAEPARLDLVPWPAHVELGRGAFALTKETTLVADARLAGEADLLRRALTEATGLPFPPGTARAGIRLELTAAGAPAEGYSLDITPTQVTLRAPQPAGVFWAAQTLLQLLPGAGPPQLPCLRIDDAPRFPWRGLMLDCSRTFQSMEYIERTLDRMALHKLNVLHLHLTDDQGWRLEIRKYPELTRRGAFFPERWNEPPEHQGFYTQEQIQALVAYAAARHIGIIPEIEMPGHSLATLSVMPQLSCTGGPFAIFPYGKGPGINQDILCAGKEDTFTFLADVLAEVAALFPSPFVHVGGDEAPKARWKACPLCQKRMRDEGLKNEEELQSWFMRRVERILAAKGKRLIGWDEILQGGLSPTAAVMSWRGTAGGVAAAKTGHDVVMTPTSHCYFDYPYGRIDSQRVFAFDPVQGLDATAAGHVLGIQANFWSHIDRSPERVDYQLFPRLLALAERAWSPAEDNDWPGYLRRARAQLPRLERLGVRYNPADLLEAVGAWSPESFADEQVTTLEYDVSAHVTAPGEYRVRPAYSRGKHGLFLHSAALLHGDEVVAADTHEGFAGARQANDTYVLKVPAVPPGGKWRLRLGITPGGGTDSWGQVTLTGPGAL